MTPRWLIGSPGVSPVAKCGAGYHDQLPARPMKPGVCDSMRQHMSSHGGSMTTAGDGARRGWTCLPHPDRARSCRTTPRLGRLHVTLDGMAEMDGVTAADRDRAHQDGGRRSITYKLIVDPLTPHGGSRISRGLRPTRPRVGVRARIAFVVAQRRSASRCRSEPNTPSLRGYARCNPGRPGESSVARIAGVNVPTQQAGGRSACATSTASGRPRRHDICTKLSIPEDRRVNQLSDEESAAHPRVDRPRLSAWKATFAARWR